MSLSEFLRMASRKFVSEERKSANCSTDLSSSHDDDLAELVWNNGQIMKQGQSNKARKNPTFNPFPDVESFMNDVVPSVPYTEILDHDNDIEPWLNSSIDDGSSQAYFSDLLPEISGVTANEPSLYGSFALMNKRNGDGISGRSQNVPIDTRVDSELRNSSSTGFFNPYETNQDDLSVQLMGSTSTRNSNVCFGNSNNSSHRVLNFTNFSRPVSMYRQNLQKLDGLDASCSVAVERAQNEEKITVVVNSSIPIKSTLFQPLITRKEMGSCNEINLVSTKPDPGPSVVKSPCSTYSLYPEDSNKNDNLQSSDIDIAKVLTIGEKMAEPLLAASSVCSGNSAELASNDQTHKRKDRDNEESDSQSEDNEEEYVGRKKAVPAQGASGSKRSRAAQVHNLSERRRRDRINEKMRALQELIPNCNKADKASKLDEAIEYLKSLQLQVQVMSMGAGYCMPHQMMFPTPMPHMHAAHLQHYPQVCGGMGFGMGMIDMNSGVPRFPVFPMSTMQGARFSSPPMYGPGAHFYGLPVQGIPMSVPRAPSLFTSLGQPIISSTGVSNTQPVAPKTSPDASVQNKLEDVNGAFDHPLSIQKEEQVVDASVNLTNMKDDVSRKKSCFRPYLGKNQNQ